MLFYVARSVFQLPQSVPFAFDDFDPLSLLKKRILNGPVPDVVDDLAVHAFAFLLFVCVWNSDGE